MLRHLPSHTRLRSTSHLFLLLILLSTCHTYGRHERDDSPSPNSSANTSLVESDPSPAPEPPPEPVHLITFAESPKSSSSEASRADWEWGLGIFLCLGGAAGTNLGLTIQKLSFLRNDALHMSAQRSAMQQPLWIIGMAVFLTGQVLNLIAFGYTSQALAATLGAFSLVTNGIFAPLILKEHLTQTIVISIGVIVSGSALVVLASSHNTQDYTLQELVMLFQRDLFIGYMSILIFAFTICLLLMWRENIIVNRAIKKLVEWEETQHAVKSEYDPRIPSKTTSLHIDPEIEGRGNQVVASSSRTSINGGAAKPVETDALIGEHRLSPPPELRVTPPTPVTPIVAGAILSSWSVLFGKCTVQLGKASLQRANEFGHPLSWILTIIFLTCAIFAVVFLNLGLRRGTALFVVPLYYVLNTILAILGGLIYFEEFQHFTPVQGALFGVGVILTVIGVWVGSKEQVEEEEGFLDELIEEAEEAAEAEHLTTTGQAEMNEDQRSTSPTTSDSFSDTLSPASYAQYHQQHHVHTSNISPSSSSYLHASALHLPHTIPESETSSPNAAYHHGRRQSGVRYDQDHDDYSDADGNNPADLDEEIDIRTATQQYLHQNRHHFEGAGGEWTSPPEHRHNLSNHSFTSSGDGSEMAVTDAEFQKMLEASEKGAHAASILAAAGQLRQSPTMAQQQQQVQSISPFHGHTSSGQFRLNPSLSTPQPNHSQAGGHHHPRYGSMSSTTHPPHASFSLTPGQLTTRSLSMSHHTRPPLLDLTRLTPAQRHRHAQLEAAHVAATRRYSLNQKSYAGSFGGGGSGAAAATGSKPGGKDEPKTERRYSVAVIGLGIS